MLCAIRTPVKIENINLLLLSIIVDAITYRKVKEKKLMLIQITEEKAGNYQSVVKEATVINDLPNYYLSNHRIHMRMYNSRCIIVSSACFTKEQEERGLPARVRNQG